MLKLFFDVYCLYTRMYTVCILCCILFVYPFVYCLYTTLYTLPILCLYCAYTVGSSFEGFGAGDDFDDFVGDGGLAGFVVAEGEVFEEFGGVVGGFLHGCHACAVFGGEGVEDDAVEGGAEGEGYHLAEDVVFGGFEDVVVGGGGGASHTGIARFSSEGEELFGGEDLGEGVFELVVDDFDMVELCGGEALHDVVGEGCDFVEGGAVEEVVVGGEGEVALACEEFGAFLADGHDVELCAGGEGGAVVVDALLGLLEDVAVEGAAESFVGGDHHEQHVLVRSLGVVGGSDAVAGVDVGDDFLQLVGIGAHADDGVLRAPELGGGDHLHSRGDLLRGGDGGYARAYFFEVGHGSVFSGQWSVVSGRWSVVSGRWSVVSGRWSVVSGRWSVVGGQCLEGYL